MVGWSILASLARQSLAEWETVFETVSSPLGSVDVGVSKGIEEASNEIDSERAPLSSNHVLRVTGSASPANISHKVKIFLVIISNTAVSSEGLWIIASLS